MRNHESPERSGDQRRSRRERAVWSSVAVLLVAAVLAFTITPSVLAQNYSETDRVVDVFESVLRFIQQNYVDEVDADALLEGALEGMFDSLDDPYSTYLDADQMRGLTDTTTGEFGGVGLYIAKEQVEAQDDSGFVRVVSPIEDTPAFRAGVRAGDLIVALREEDDEEFETTSGLSIDEVVNRLRGTPGTDVTIRIRRGTRAEFPVTLERAIIEVPTVKYAMIPDDIGFLRIIQFTPRTAERVSAAVEFFESNEYESMIIDLRSNPGGLLDGVVDVADLFFERGTIVGTSGRVPQENERFTASPGAEIDEDIPVVVLIDEGSASAAEILAGSLQDRGRAYLIGETTFGKGSVQQVRRLGEGGFRMTMSRYYLPSGRYIDEVGVDPDEVVEPPELSDEQAEEYARLIESDRVAEWVRANSDPSEIDVDRFVERLQADGFDLPDRWIELTVRNEVNRQNNVQIVYDLEFDEVLQEAVRLLRTGEVSRR
ncbi:MAG: S41 family peptidase [Spirochaetota bacterium]